MRADPQITYELRAMARQDYSANLTRLLNSAADEIDALHEIERMQQWRPIETAPKDGTRILAWCVHAMASATGDEADDFRGPVIARWIDHNGGGWCWHGLAGKFTHWQPLASNPAKAE